MPPARLERATPGLGILCSIHLSYGGSFADSIAYAVPHVSLRLVGYRLVTARSCRRRSGENSLRKCVQARGFGALEPVGVDLHRHRR